MRQACVMVSTMFTMREIAREVLPLVVIAWATFVILGGALKAVEKSGSPDEGAAVSAGLGLCAVSVAAVLSTGLAKRVRPALRSFVPKPLESAASLFQARRPAAYTEPPPGPPPLQLSQVLRT